MLAPWPMSTYVLVMRSLFALGGALLSVCCSSSSPTAASPEKASTPTFHPTTPTASVAVAPISSVPEPQPSPAPTTPPAKEASGSDATTGPVPKVAVTNIGMHIGGGPNDDATKRPIRVAIEPHFESLQRCYGRAEGTVGGDFGVDLRIPKNGGRAKISPPRTSIKGEQFQKCALGVLEQVDFPPPKGGAMMVSYSLRFAPIP